VKDTNFKFEFTSKGVKDAIEKGLDTSDPKIYLLNGRVQDTIENGIKRVGGVKRDRKERIDLTIEKGEKL